MNDKVLQNFLQRQENDAAEINTQSTIVKLEPVERPEDPLQPPLGYVATLDCTSLIRKEPGEIIETRQPCIVGFRFNPGYLRKVEAHRVVCFIGPFNIFHPNISPPAICVGEIKPGTELVDLLHQVYEIITYANFAAHDPLNEMAAEWARNHLDRFPLDRRPLRNLRTRPKGNE